MKLYATTTSERASKGQGGEYLIIDITGENKQNLGRIEVKWYEELEKYSAEYFYPNGNNYNIFSIDKTKGNNQKGEIIEPWDINPADNR